MNLLGIILIYVLAIYIFCMIIYFIKRKRISKFDKIANKNYKDAILIMKKLCEDVPFICNDMEILLLVIPIKSEYRYEACYIKNGIMWYEISYLGNNSRNKLLNLFKSKNKLYALKFYNYFKKNESKIMEVYEKKLNKYVNGNF